MFRQCVLLLSLISMSFVAKAESFLDVFPQATVSVYGYNLTKDKELLAVAPDNYMQGASTIKIMTALQAMKTFGPYYRFETIAYASRKPRNGVLSGPLTIEFVGDPSLKTRDLTILAQRIKSAGIDKITGALIINVGRYIGHDHATAWNMSDRSICFSSENSAAQVNYNCIKGLLKNNGADGTIAEFESDDPVIKVTSEVVTVKSDKNKTCELNYDNDVDLSFRLSGCLEYRKQGQPLHLAVPNGNLYTANMMLKSLRDAGVSVSSVKIQETPLEKDLIKIASIYGDSITDLMRVMLTKSENHIAEQLFRTSAYAATKAPVNYTIATQVARKLNRQYGLKDTVKVDGSGLSYHNRTTTRDLVMAMKAINEIDAKTGILATFPNAQQGTLIAHKAFKNHPDLIGKTGAIFAAYNFVGQFKNAEGDTIIFAYMINNQVQRDRNKRDKFEQLLLEALNNGQ